MLFLPPQIASWVNFTTEFWYKPDHLTNTVLGRTFVWDLQQAELPAPTVAVALTSLCREPREAAASWPHACLQAVSLTQRYYGRQPKRGSGRRR